MSAPPVAPSRDRRRPRPARLLAAALAEPTSAWHVRVVGDVRPCADETPATTWARLEAALAEIGVEPLVQGDDAAGDTVALDVTLTVPARDDRGARAVGVALLDVTVERLGGRLRIDRAALDQASRATSASTVSASATERSSR